MEFNIGHPVAYGMPEEAAAMFAQSPVFSLLPAEKEDGPLKIANYPGEGILMSGYLMGEKYLRNKASIVEAPLGKGKIILLGFGVQQRGQSWGTFKLLFNSLFYGSSM